MPARLTPISTVAAVLLTALFGIAGLGITDASAAGSAADGGWFSGLHETVQLRTKAIARITARSVTEEAAIADIPATAPTPPTTTPPPPPPVSDPASFLFPAAGPVTSPFGPRWGRAHNGVDIAAPTGAPIVAAQRGTVTFAGWKNGYGNTVVVDHGSGITTLYAHQSSIGVRAGQPVTRGQLLGTVGATGRVTAPHLHYEVAVGGVPRNPQPWL